MNDPDFEDRPSNELSPGFTRFVLVTLGVFILLVAAHGYRIFLLYRDFDSGLFGTASGSLGTLMGPSTSTDFPLTASSTLEELARQDLFLASYSPLGVDITELEAAPTESGEKPVFIPLLLEAFATFTRHLELEKELETRFVPQVGSFLPTVTNVASLQHATLFGPDILIGGLSDVGRLLHALANYQAATGRVRASLRTILVGLYIAHFAENLPGIQPTLMNKMVGIILRDIMGGALLNVIPGTRLGREETRRLIFWLWEAERRRPTLFLLAWADRQAIRNLGSDVRAHLASSPGIHAPNRFVDAYGNHRLLEPILANRYEPWLKALQASFSVAMFRLKALKVTMDELKKRPVTFGSHWLGYAIWPEQYFLEKDLYLGRPLFGRILEQEYSSDERIRGAQNALGLYAYHTARGDWPVDLPTLESWLGMTLPLDIYTDRPHLYEIGTFPRLLSVGPDGHPGTLDDIRFLPVWNDPAFSPIAKGVTVTPDELPLEFSQKEGAPAPVTAKLH